MNPFLSQITYHLYEDENKRSSVEGFRSKDSIELLRQKAFIYDLFKAIDNIDTNIDRLKPDLNSEFVKSVIIEIRSCRGNLALMNFDKDFLEEWGLLGDFNLEGYSL